jgi:polar amino acid transport system permease protein
MLAGSNIAGGNMLRKIVLTWFPIILGAAVYPLFSVLMSGLGYTPRIAILVMIPAAAGMAGGPLMGVVVGLVGSAIPILLGEPDGSWNVVVLATLTGLIASLPNLLLTESKRRNPSSLLARFEQWREEHSVPNLLFLGLFVYILWLAWTAAVPLFNLDLELTSLSGVVLRDFPLSLILILVVTPLFYGLFSLAKNEGPRVDAWWWLVAGVVALVVMMMELLPDPYRRIVAFVSDGIFVSITLTVSAFILTLIVGMFVGLGRLAKSKIIYGATSLYVEMVRGIPLLVQLMWWYFAFPPVLQRLGKSMNIPMLAEYQANAIAMAIIGLVICYAAYMSEIYRAGIQSIPTGQMEAARSQGMGYFQAMRHIILPQAIRVILPPMGNEFIALLKDSSLVSAVAVADLSRRGREFTSAQFIPIETWMMVALLYLIMTLLSARIVGWVERRTRFER